MPQVINIITGRRINTENARWSEHHQGYLHYASSVKRAVIVNVVDERYDSCRIEWDWFQRSDTFREVRVFNRNQSGNIIVIGLANNCVVNGEIHPFTYRGYEYYSHVVDGEPMVDIDGVQIPEYATIKLTKVIFGDESGKVTYKQFAHHYNTTNNTNVQGSTTTAPKRGEEYSKFRFVDRMYCIDQGIERRVDGVSCRVSRADALGIDEYNQAPSDYDGRLFVYHQGSGYRSDYDAPMVEGKWYIGIEAEKQDDIARKYAMYLNGKCSGWAAESDGSLGNGGVEFISPILPLHDGSQVRKNFQRNRWMLDAALDCNGRAAASNCGGHITISKKGMSGSELQEHLHHFAPLLYSLYIGRLNTHYGGAVRKRRFDSRQAFCTKSFGVEIRIFSGVPSMEGAWWRVQLMQVMANMIDSGKVNSYKDVANAMVETKHPLRKVLRKMYDSKRIRDKFALVLAFGHLYSTEGNTTISLDGTSTEVKHKASRIMTSLNEFNEVKRCVRRLWGVDHGDLSVSA